VKRKLGRFELAHEGTLFLDEVCDMSPLLQVKLLRVLQEQEFERVGGEESVKVDVRVISATHRNLKVEVEEGRFREDLYYRMHVVVCEVPALRDHREDIPLLVEHFVRKQGPRLNPTVTAVGPAALARLCGYHWPGNVRELENAVEQALVFAEGSTIEVDALPPVFRETSPKNVLPLPAGDRTLPEILEELERQLILRAYDETKGVKTETARKLGIKTSALYYKLEKYGIGFVAGREGEVVAEVDEAKEP
jgi:two-component system response regulator HydG